VNGISDDGAVAVGDCLKINNTLKELYMNVNNKSCKGAKEILKLLK